MKTNESKMNSRDTGESCLFILTGEDKYMELNKEKIL